MGTDSHCTQAEWGQDLRAYLQQHSNQECLQELSPWRLAEAATNDQQPSHLG